MMNYSKIKRFSISKVQKGIGLIELLISMLIGLFVMAGVVQMFATTTQNAAAVSGSSKIQENIRYAFYRMREDVSQAGNLGCFNASYTDNGFFQVSPVNNMLGLNKDSGEFYDFYGFVYGSESATSSTFPAGDVTTNTDTLSVRYVSHATRFDITSYTKAGDISLTIDDTHTAYSTLEQNQIVVASDCNSTSIFMVTNDPSTSNGVLEFKPNIVSTTLNNGQFNSPSTLFGDFYFPNRALTSAGRATKARYSSIPYIYAGTTGAYQYFIGDSSAATETCHAIDRPQHCSLFRRTNAFNQELVQGVHNLQVEYGWTNDAGELIFSNAMGVNDQDAWRQVDRVNVTLSFNSIENVIAEGNNLSKLITRDITQTFNLPNQL